MAVEAEFDHVSENRGLIQTPARGGQADGAAAADVAAEVEFQEHAPAGVRINAVVEAVQLH